MILKKRRYKNKKVEQGKLLYVNETNQKKEHEKN